MGQDKKAVGLLKLARRLGSSAQGLTLDEMAEVIGYDRRTAERYRCELEEIFPQMTAVQDGREKRFHIPCGLDSLFQTPTAEELLELTTTITELEGKGAMGEARARCLEDLKDKVCSAMKRSMNRVAPDLEVLMQSELIAVRAGARRLDDPNTLKLIREAILAMKALRFVYLRGSKPGTARIVTPCGVVFDHSAWLVAIENGQTQEKTYRLDEMRSVEILKDEARRPEDFNLVEYKSKSFGLYHDEEQDVVLHLLPGALDQEGKVRWQFHPKQTVEYLGKNEGALVRFRSGGMKELIWHLFTWENDLEIVAPESLRRSMVSNLTVARDRHDTEPRYLQNLKKK